MDNYDLLVLGAGPGGYTAAFRAADLGKKVLLVERYESLGGVCLNVGCIPSKALLHMAKVIDEAHHASSNGISFSSPKVELDKLRGWKDGVVKKLTSGLNMLAKQRKVTVIQGEGKFIDSHSMEIKKNDGSIETVKFENAIIAVGSRPVKLPFLPDDDRIISSTGALALKDIPKRMLIIGGGIIGVEMATVYSALGSEVTIVELADTILFGVDEDISKTLKKKLDKKLKKILTKAKLSKVVAEKKCLKASIEIDGKEEILEFDKILVSVGRIPNGKDIAAEKAGVNVDEKGFIRVDDQMRTNVSNIFAIGDVIGNPMLAHKSIPQGKLVAEVIAGHNYKFTPKVIPNVAYTDPEIAWAGLSETEAKKNNIPYKVGVFPWMASGRSLAQGRDEGITKVIFDPKTRKILGAAIVGSNAGDLIGEICLAIEMGCEAEDISLTIHPHPTLAETIPLACEDFEGTITDLLPRKK